MNFRFFASTGSRRAAQARADKHARRNAGFAFTSLAAVLCLLMASCATAPSAPLANAPAQFSASGEAETPERWWQSFGDEELNRLVEQAMADNLDVLTAWDRLDQATAIAKIAGSPLWPQIEGGFSVTDTDLVNGSDPFVVEDTFYGASLIAGYEVDLWGRIRSGRRAALTDLRSSGEDLDTVAVTVSSEIAGTWYELLEKREQLRILADQAEVNRTVLDLLELRFNQGLTAAAEVLQQRQQLAATEGEVPLVRSRLSVLNHELAVLLGRNPTSAFASSDAALPELPPFPDAGLPADLLLRRPDVRAAQLRVEAADYRVSEAIADRFPRLSISMSAQDTESGFSSLFDDWIRNLAANITAPIVDGGRRRAEVERTRAVASERLHDFEKAVLRALKEVEDAIVREQRQAEFVVNLGEQVAIARQTVEFTRDRYLNGDTDYLPVLIALRTLQSLERQELEARRQLITFRISLYRALAGGWGIERGPSEREDIAMNEGDVS